MANWTPMRRLLAAKKVQVHDETGIQAYWRDYLIDIELDSVLGVGCWYIRVKHPNGCYVCDGWWSNSEDKTLEEAVAQAFHGADLLGTDA
ncbi:hypothetical protein EHZ19_10710 [Paraburkholderia bannensis]|nr:hypothetical protein [Paraburkholderia bannensis]RQM48666.1 hypothetical protein EHZ19_10710 [Paraburkholderia bannensis]